MDLSFEILDPTDAGAVAEYHKVYRSSFTEDYDHPWSFEELQHLLIGNAWMRRLALIARDGEQIVGIAQVDLPQRDNVTAAFVEIGVPPKYRRAGIGTALLERVEKYATEDGRELLLTETIRSFEADEGPSHGFVRAHGFEPDARNIQRELRLPAEVVAPELPGGFRFVSWRATPPAEWVDQYAKLRSLLNQEAPAGLLELENENWDADRVRLEADQWQRQRRTPQTVIVVGPGDVVAGHTQLVFSETNPTVYQWDTLVLPEHRGLGLGRALKRRAMHEAADLLEGRERITTWNDENNTHMIALNEELGYVPVAVADQWLKRLPVPN